MNEPSIIAAGRATSVEDNFRVHKSAYSITDKSQRNQTEDAWVFFEETASLRSVSMAINLLKSVLRESFWTVLPIIQSTATSNRTENGVDCPDLLYFYRMNWRDYIHSDTEIVMGKPTIKGTRISVELILELLSEGWTYDQIFESYPSLTKSHLTAIYAFLHDCVQQELYFPLTSKGAWCVFWQMKISLVQVSWFY